MLSLSLARFGRQHVSITGGLRALRVKYETDKGADNYESDMTFWGPLLGGGSFRW